ncbi:MAG: hypothetical protein P8N13_04575, partial [Ilumatobacter sp.]|nr:hypothetical protein [Ilumatobacter sp.]
MTKPENAEAGNNNVDPWAPGGAMTNVPQSQLLRTHFKFKPADETAISMSDPSQARPKDLEQRNRGAAPNDAGGHRGRWLAGSSLVMVLAIGAVLATADNGDSNTQDTSNTTRQMGSSTKAVDILPMVTAPRSTPPRLSTDATAGEFEVTGPAERLVLAAAPREFIVDLAPELATINPTEVVALGMSGLYEISLPSGRV